MKVGDVRITKEIAKWRECEQCGLPAKWRLTFLLNGARGNPASSAYGRDDCSWCNDLEIFACKEHKASLHRNPPSGYGWCATFPLKNFKHMGFYWSKEIKVKE